MDVLLSIAGIGDFGRQPREREGWYSIGDRQAEAAPIRREGREKTWCMLCYGEAGPLRCRPTVFPGL